MSLYDGREQTEAKHAILRRYLRDMSYKILSTWQSLDFIDGFSGPWENKDAALSDTSIGIALETLQSVAEAKGLPAGRVRCIFNEKSRKAFTRLEEFLDGSRDQFPLVEVRTFQGAFESNATVIRAAANHQFRLLFVDPTGFTGFSLEALKKFDGRSSEMIINFMRPFIHRFVSKPREEQIAWLDGLIGSDAADQILQGDVTGEVILEVYLRVLKEELGYRFAGESPIHDPDKNQENFHLVFGTHHPEGMRLMREVEFKALEQHDQRRFDKKHMSGPQGDLFEAVDDAEIFGPYARKRTIHQNMLRDRLIEILSKSKTGRTFKTLRAAVQEGLYLRHKEISDEVKAMAAEGLVHASWKDRGGKSPANDDKIRLCD